MKSIFISILLLAASCNQEAKKEHTASLVETATVLTINAETYRKWAVVKTNEGDTVAAKVLYKIHAELLREADSVISLAPPSKKEQLAKLFIQEDSIKLSGLLQSTKSIY